MLQPFFPDDIPDIEKRPWDDEEPDDDKVLYTQY